MKLYCLPLHPQAKKPYYVHNSMDSATKEAARLSFKLQCDVLILEAIGIVHVFK